MIALASVVLAQATTPDPAPLTGLRTPQEIFEQRCAKCHGNDGKLSPEEIQALVAFVRAFGKK
jgi:mono/diheme cytochrome c family protein